MGWLRSGPVLDGRLLIVTGKGGVGRSAVTAALARSRAVAGMRVLALAFDGTQGLAAHLGLVELTATPAAGVDGVHAAAVVPESALDEYVRHRLGANPLRLATRVFRGVARIVPGVRDIVLIGKAIYEANRGLWDGVIVDAPPAGKIDSSLQAPATIESIAPGGTVREEATRLRTTLQDDEQSGLVLVATPDELALTEAKGVIDTANQLGLTSLRIRVANRVLEDPGFAVPPDADTASAVAARLHLELRAEQQRLLTTFPAAVRLPLLLGPRTSVEVSAALAGHLSSL